MTRPRTPGQRSIAGKEGFSLLELLVASVVTTLFFGMAFTYLTETSEFSSRSASSADARQTTRLVLDRIGNDIRAAGADPTGDAFDAGEEIFLETTETRLRMRRDRAIDFNGDGDTFDVVDINDDGDTHDTDENENGDRALDDPWEDVTYVHDPDAGTLVIVDNVTGQEHMLAERVVANPDGGPMFEYEWLGGEIVAITVVITTESAFMDLVTGEPQPSTGRITARPRMIRASLLDSVEGSG